MNLLIARSSPRPSGIGQSHHKLYQSLKKIYLGMCRSSPYLLHIFIQITQLTSLKESYDDSNVNSGLVTFVNVLKRYSCYIYYSHGE